MSSKIEMKPGELVAYEDVEIYRGEKLVLKEVTFTLKEGEFHYLVGRVGSGKSSLLKTMYGDVRVKMGLKAEAMGFNLLRLHRKDIPYLRRKIGIVFQDFQLLPDRSVAANLRFVLEATGWKKGVMMEDRLHDVLKDVGMENKSYKMPHELSGGEQQRVVIARALLNEPKLILADEPTGNLDPKTGYNIVSLLHDLKDNGHTILMATHNMKIVDDFPGNVMTCEDGLLNPNS